MSNAANPGTAANPYAPPAARVDDVAVDSAAEATRREHINHEASIKAVGILYYLGGVGVVIAGVGALAGVKGGMHVGLAIGLGLVAVGVLQFFAGWGVRGLRSWGRVLGTILSVIGLLSFPVGTLINGYILYLFFSRKGGTIFSPGYQDVIAATPHVKYRTSIVVWIFLALVVGLLVVAVALPMLRG